MKKLCLMLAMALITIFFVGCNDTPNIKPDENPDNTPVISVENNSGFGLISLSKCQRFDADWGEEQPLRMVKWQSIKLSDEDAEKYPELSDALAALNNEEDEAATSQMQAFREYTDYEGSSTLYANTEKYILRADKAVVSILGEYESYSGGAHGYYAKAGTNLSPETGEEIDLFDVVTDKDTLFTLIFDHLLENYEGEFYEEKREDLYEHFDNGLNWSIDYNKINIYFNPYEIASYAAGLIEIELWFDEHPEMIDKKYTDAPSSYAVELSHFKEFKFDRDKSDGKRDVILAGSYGSKDYECDQLAISLNLREYTEDELYGVQFTPVLVCLEGEYYLYGEIGTENGSNYINVYDLNGSEVKKIETIELGFKKLSDYEGNEFVGYYREIMNNPLNVNLETYLYLLDSPNSAYKNYSINKTTALPETDDEYFAFSEDTGEKITLCDIEVQVLPDGETLTLPEGTTLMPLYTDGSSYVDFIFEAGQRCRVNIQSRNGINTVNGKDVSECFADKYFGSEVESEDYPYLAQLFVPYTLYEDEEQGTSRIELIQLVAENNDEVDRINSEINELYKEYLYNYAYSDEKWCDFLAWPTVTDRYLNAVVTHIDYPTSGTYGKVSSWVYDQKTGKQYTLEEALKDAGTSVEGLLSDFDGAVDYWGGRAYGIDSLAFRMLANGKAQFIAGVEVGNEYDTYIYFMNWSDGGIETWDSLPFNPADVKGNFADAPLVCQTDEVDSLYTGEDNTGILSFEEAADELCEIYEVKEALENGMILVDYDMVEYINDIPHTCIALATDHEDHTVVEKIYAVAPESVYEYDAALDEWTAVGFG